MSLNADRLSMAKSDFLARILNEMKVDVIALQD